MNLAQNTREEKGLNLTDTLKRVTECNLYTRKGATATATDPKPSNPRVKKEQGGSAQLPFVVARLKHGDIKRPSSRKTGGAPSWKNASGNQPPAIDGGSTAPASVQTEEGKRARIILTL